MKGWELYIEGFPSPASIISVLPKGACPHQLICLMIMARLKCEYEKNNDCSQHMGVSENSGTPKPSILLGFSL